ncbi:hypothetical protein Q6A75_04620 [Aliarcobacter skirrowii]|uniref:hypothetical protein n=1 Tax=Aliarcobacter skirrowii TaxID=28200 RepID=UPI0029BEEB39|nr:hypothetical protein [Aliarcobacter skirrowii]MDX4048209.1 hypothetical protein [Aliarcobacter skirrowii]
MIKKSYKLIEFGNKDHNILVLLCIAIFAFTLTFVSTFSFSCAKLSFNQVFKRNVKSALRRVAWFVRNSYLKLRIINDDNFDFTEDLELDEVLIVEKFLKKRETKLKKENFLAEYLFLLSYKLHFFAKNKDIKSLKIELYKFLQVSNSLLDFILNNRPKTFKQTTKKTKDNFDFSKNAKNMLETFSKYIKKEDYPWYVISGTFLGLHRERGFLKHDIDLDFGINYEDIENIDKFIDVLKRLPNITIKNIIYMPNIKIEKNEIFYDNRIGIIKLVDKSGIQIDMFIHYRQNGKIVHGSKIHLWENSPFELVIDNLEGIELYCPNNADVYLTENYGDWRTPVKEFSCSTGTPNLTVVSNFYSISFFLRRLVFITQGKEEKMSYEKVLSMLENQKIVVDKKINIPFIKE